MILNIYEDKDEDTNWWDDIEFKNVLHELSLAIKNDVDDPKKIQGNLNTFSIEDRKKISTALENAYKKACKAREYEKQGEQKKAIEKWKEIFGEEFPSYTGE